MTLVEEMLAALAAKRDLVEAALFYTGTHAYDDVVRMVEAGEAQVWAGHTSFVVTEIQMWPRHKTLHVFLAGGNQQELEAMQPSLAAWGRANGCTEATMIGRRGWERSFLPRTGWRSSMVMFTKPLVEEAPHGEGIRKSDRR